MGCEKIRRRIQEASRSVIELIMKPKKEEFIWYCIRSSCNAIIMKTSKPFLQDGVIRCKRCNEVITFDALMKHNRHNVKRYLEVISEVIPDS